MAWRRPSMRSHRSATATPAAVSWSGSVTSISSTSGSVGSLRAVRRVRDSPRPAPDRSSSAPSSWASLATAKAKDASVRTPVTRMCLPSRMPMGEEATEQERRNRRTGPAVRRIEAALPAGGGRGGRPSGDALHDRRRPVEEELDLAGRDGLREEEPLHPPATQANELDQVLLALGPFGHHLESERLAEPHDGLDDPLVGGVGADAVHEDPVDLQHVHRELLELGHRAVPGTEVVHG